MSFESVVLGSMSPRKTKEMLGHKKLIERLTKSRVSNVFMGKGFMRFKYDGQIHSFKVQIKPYVRWVGTWDNKTLYLDDDIRFKKDQLCTSIHEAIESYVARKYGLDRDYTAHYVATMVEHTYAKSIDLNWDDYEMRTELIYRRIGNERK
jgi:hypothetical protein